MAATSTNIKEFTINNNNNHFNSNEKNYKDINAEQVDDYVLTNTSKNMDSTTELKHQDDFDSQSDELELKKLNIEVMKPSERKTEDSNQLSSVMDKLYMGADDNKDDESEIVNATQNEISTEYETEIKTNLKTDVNTTSVTSSISICRNREKIEGINLDINYHPHCQYHNQSNECNNDCYQILKMVTANSQPLLVTTAINTCSHVISKCMSQSSSTATITSSSSTSSPILIDSPSITGPQPISLSSSSSLFLSRPPLSMIPSYARILPKTQSLDLVDDQCDDDMHVSVNIDDEDDLCRTKKRSLNSKGTIIVGQQLQQQGTAIYGHSSVTRPITNSQSQTADISSINYSANKGTIPKIQSLESRPIFPNVPYSPYGSPYGSPRSNRRRTPLRESRRISIEQTGSFLQLNQYKLMDQIGQGSYGLVKLAYSEEDSTHYAMKILSKRKLLRKAGLIGRGPKKTTSPLDRVYREIAVLKKLDHPNVVKLIEVLDDPLEDSLYLVFELVQQGEVLSIPTDRPLNEERAWSIFRDAVKGLEYLHYQRIIHADIKPGNLLLAECGGVKIADLGVCNEFLGEDAAMNNGSSAGTPAFRAPETLIPGKHVYSGKAADIWSLGATLYALIYGNVPFVAASVPAVYEKIKNDELHFPASPVINSDLRDLIEKMLTKDPSQRITLPQIKEHPWTTSNSVHLLPSEEENCRLVQVSDEDINSVVKSIPKLDTLILIKTMLKNHSFQNPFSRGISGWAPQRGGSRLERFTKAGRSNSAPGAYHLSDRQLSSENILPVVSESISGSCNEPSD